MASESSRPTPLGVARARFVDGLPRKAAELRGSIALLAATPAEERPREELRRRLHALFASAQVFQIAPLTAALKDAIARLDRAKDERRSLSDDDVESLALLASTLPVIGQAEPSGPPLGEPPRSASEIAIEGPETPEVVIPKTSRLPGPRASAPPGSYVQRTTLTAMVAAPGESPSEPARPPTVRPPSMRPQRSSTLRGLTAATHGAPVIVGEPLAETKSSRMLETVVSVLVVDAAEWQARVRAELPAERFEVLGAADPEEALRLARSSSPDAVLVDHALLVRHGVDLVRRLRDDPLTDFVPVIAMIPVGAPSDPIAARELGAEDILAKPFDAATLEATLARVTGTDASRGTASGMAGEHTIEEVATKIADEVRRGLVEATDRGHDLRVPLGDGAEVLAAAWSVIGRVRAHLSSRSGGRVHFQDGRAAGGPAFLALVDEDESAEPKSAPVSLRDRHVIVADDDPAVVWFFAGLLREEGAIVEEANDGVEVLELARKKRPDVVISDILMPRLDGFALTRELKRDPALADVPVILLSWKDDFLQRMRELQSGASGYLRKESGAHQILDCVRDVLRPRARLEAQLRAGGDVRGRLERIGILPLISTTAQHRPSARITVRDAWNLFEIDLRPGPDGAGQMVDLTRTASDGSFSRGPRVVVPLLGAMAGRFAVTETDVPVRASIKEPLDVVLRRGAAQMGALVDAISGKGLALAAQVELDEDVVASLLRASPEPMREMVDALRSGRGPRQLLLDGAVSAQELESVLLDLARQGAILAVRGPDGDDRIAIAAKARGEIELPIRSPSLMPSARVEGARGPISLEPPALAASVEDSGPDLSWLPREEGTAEIVAEAHRMASEPPPRRATVSDAPVAHDPTPTPTLVDRPNADERRKADERPKLDASELRIGRDPTPSPIGIGSDPTPSGILDLDAPDHAPLPSKGERAAPPEPAPPKRKPVAPAAPAGPAPREEGGMGALGWSFVLAVLAIVGFMGFRTYFQAPAGSPDLVAEPTPTEPAGDTATVGAPPHIDDTSPAEIADAPESEPPSALSSYGREEDGIAGGFAVVVPDGHGLVVLETAEDGRDLSVRIGADAHAVQGAPVALTMPEGIHELSFVHGDDLAFRFIRVRAGHTRYVPAP